MMSLWFADAARVFGPCVSLETEVVGLAWKEDCASASAVAAAAAAAASAVGLAPLSSSSLSSSLYPGFRRRAAARCLRGPACLITSLGRDVRDPISSSRYVPSPHGTW